jgi:hypothetical protein
MSKIRTVDRVVRARSIAMRAPDDPRCVRAVSIDGRTVNARGAR